MFGRYSQECRKWPKHRTSKQILTSHKVLRVMVANPIILLFVRCRRYRHASNSPCIFFWRPLQVVCCCHPKTQLRVKASKDWCYVRVFLQNSKLPRSATQALNYQVCLLGPVVG